MKKLILLLALAFVMCGCYRQNVDGSYSTGNALNEFIPLNPFLFGLTNNK